MYRLKGILVKKKCIGLRVLFICENNNNNNMGHIELTSPLKDHVKVIGFTTYLEQLISDSNPFGLPKDSHPIKFAFS